MLGDIYVHLLNDDKQSTKTIQAVTSRCEHCELLSSSVVNSMHSCMMGSSQIVTVLSLLVAPHRSANLVTFIIYLLAKYMY